MKKLISLLTFMCICFLGFSQTKTVVAKKDPPVKTYVIILSEPELVTLYKMVMEADLYSDKGKNLYLEALKKKTILMPEKTDTAIKK
jgi:hypothetical protein